MKEKTCVQPFIDKAQQIFERNGSLKEALQTISPYQKKVDTLIHNVSTDAKIVHAIGVSTIGLGTIAVYEYARAKGLPLPDSGVVLSAVLPVKSFSSEQEAIHIHSVLEEPTSFDHPLEVSGYFSDPSGKLHRGTPGWTINADGTQTAISTDNLTGVSFPREEINEQ